MNISDFCRETRNYFAKKRIFGTFTITDNNLKIDGMQYGQYFAIFDSIFNDGVHQYECDSLNDETFDGAIVFMAVPQEVLALIDEINAWESKNADVLNSPYQSESFGGYSYSKETGNNGGLTWQSHFADRLNRWRKL